MADAMNMGNLTTIGESLSIADSWRESDLGFDSSVEPRQFGKDDVELNADNHQEIFQDLIDSAIRMLFVNLAVLSEDCLDFLIKRAGDVPPNYLKPKIEWAKARVRPEHSWAPNGMLEMCAVRNVLVHNRGVINSKAISILNGAEINTVEEGHEVVLSFGDLFRYKRALRTTVGEIERLDQ
jgi:hypothetical protein